MKFIIYIIIAATVMAACQSGPDYKTVRDEVTIFHDSLMLRHEQLITNQMTLDTLLRQLPASQMNDTAAKAAGIRKMLRTMQQTEDEMNDWMHAFEPDISGKSKEEAVRYFQNEKKKIVSLDVRYKHDLAASDSLISTLKK
ncbi:hypothetical protein [Pedobacter sp. SYP-B3415]|uniref:hypothetical protein n=1 Tax=Pedobacter sp. SYP-B3415 TaxID=2496641 RepID=UPI00101E0451|nr:hypothetical protein [Pedobacter sp. SYP-B3415]